MFSETNQNGSGEIDSQHLKFRQFIELSKEFIKKYGGNNFLTVDFPKTIGTIHRGNMELYFSHLVFQKKLWPGQT